MTKKGADPGSGYKHPGSATLVVKDSQKWGFSTDRQRMILLVEDVQNGLRLAVLDVIVDGERDALDGILEVGLRDGAVVDVDGGAGGGLLQRHEVPQRGGVGQLHL
jgi:hypothetical protein